MFGLTQKEKKNVTERAEIEALQKDLLTLMLKKAGVKYDDLIRSSIKGWIGENLDLLADNEVERFKKILL
ncbi:hypothetical protein AGMMS49525_11080 [Bacteroidia bacterium]|nr:hypothetical protein AGMMS49525_11080 [Bacteroidia bacterium]